MLIGGVYMCCKFDKHQKKEKKRQKKYIFKTIIRFFFIFALNSIFIVCLNIL